MAYDARLTSLAQKMGEFYDNPLRYEEIWASYLDRFAYVAITRGAGVIDYEDPFDSVMGFMFDGDPEMVKRMLSEYKQMVEVLEEINYSDAKWWRDHYEEAVQKYNELNGK